MLYNMAMIDKCGPDVNNMQEMGRLLGTLPSREAGRKHGFHLTNRRTNSRISSTFSAPKRSAKPLCTVFDFGPRLHKPILITLKTDSRWAIRHLICTLRYYYSLMFSLCILY